MFEYKCIVGSASPHPIDGSPEYNFYFNQKTMRIDDTLNEMSKDNWEPIHFALPTVYPVFRDRPNDAPATIIFRREKQ
jgi:hypothetical protein